MRSRSEWRHSVFADSASHLFQRVPFSSRATFSSNYALSVSHFPGCHAKKMDAFPSLPCDVEEFPHDMLRLEPIPVDSPDDGPYASVIVAIRNQEIAELKKELPELIIGRRRNDMTLGNFDTALMGIIAVGLFVAFIGVYKKGLVDGAKAVLINVETAPAHVTNAVAGNATAFFLTAFLFSTLFCSLLVLMGFIDFFDETKCHHKSMATERHKRLLAYIQMLKRARPTTPEAFWPQIDDSLVKLKMSELKMRTKRY
jgi:hypothetical protein